MSDNLATAKCPLCGGTGLDIHLRMKVADVYAVPPASIAGASVKVPAKLLPFLFCPRHPCAYGVWGWQEDGHAVFPRD